MRFMANAIITANAPHGKSAEGSMAPTAFVGGRLRHFRPARVVTREAVYRPNPQSKEALAKEALR